MKLDIGSFMFNTDIQDGAATPSWGTALGQGDGYRIKDEHKEIMTSIIYNAISDKENVCIDLGKGRNGIESGLYELLIASKFNKIYVNDELINDAQYILAVVKENSKSHSGRKSIKYNPNIKYKEENINMECIKKICSQLGLSDSASWVVYNIETYNQDQLHLSAVVLDKNKKKVFSNVEERRNYIELVISDKNEKELILSHKRAFTNYLLEDEKVEITRKTYLRCLQDISQEYYKDVDKLFFENDLGEIKNLHANGFNNMKISEWYKNNTKNQHKSAMKKYIEFLENYQFKACNLVLYGIPGCGKSFELERRLVEDYKFDKNLIIRTTFHHEYTNTDFIGQLMPEVNENGSVIYKIVPGSFSVALSYAYNNPNKKVALIIEELNRGDAAAIFGDIFQLLDREKNIKSNIKLGVSKYPIYNSVIQSYLNNQTDILFKSIRIPENLFLFATMNTSDQNVFSLDTAFKRRWDFEKITNNYAKYNDDINTKGLKVPGTKILWPDFVEKLNKDMVKLNGQINEDKQIGLYFVDSELLIGKDDENDSKNYDIKVKKFAYKILEYLWDDVVRYNHDALFDANLLTLDELVEMYIYKSKEHKSLEVFNKDLEEIKKLRDE